MFRFSLFFCVLVSCVHLYSASDIAVQTQSLQERLHQAAHLDWSAERWRRFDEYFPETYDLSSVKPEEARLMTRISELKNGTEADTGERLLSLLEASLLTGVAQELWTYFNEVIDRVREGIRTGEEITIGDTSGVVTPKWAAELISRAFQMSFENIYSEDDLYEALAHLSLLKGVSDAPFEETLSTYVSSVNGALKSLQQLHRDTFEGIVHDLFEVLFKASEADIRDAYAWRTTALVHWYMMKESSAAQTPQLLKKLLNTCKQLLLELNELDTESKQEVARKLYRYQPYHAQEKPTRYMYCPELAQVALETCYADISFALCKAQFNTRNNAWRESLYTSYTWMMRGVRTLREQGPSPVEYLGFPFHAVWGREDKTGGLSFYQAIEMIQHISSRLQEVEGWCTEHSVELPDWESWKGVMRAQAVELAQDMWFPTCQFVPTVEIDRLEYKAGAWLRVATLFEDPLLKYLTRKRAVLVYDSEAHKSPFVQPIFDRAQRLIAESMSAPLDYVHKQADELYRLSLSTDDLYDQVKSLVQARVLLQVAEYLHKEGTESENIKEVSEQELALSISLKVDVEERLKMLLEGCYDRVKAEYEELLRKTDKNNSSRLSAVKRARRYLDQLSSDLSRWSNSRYEYTRYYPTYKLQWELPDHVSMTRLIGLNEELSDRNRDLLRASLATIAHSYRKRAQSEDTTVLIKEFTDELNCLCFELGRVSQLREVMPVLIELHMKGPLERLKAAHAGEVLQAYEEAFQCLADLKDKYPDVMPDRDPLIREVIRVVNSRRKRMPGKDPLDYAKVRLIPSDDWFTELLKEEDGVTIVKVSKQDILFILKSYGWHLLESGEMVPEHWHDERIKQLQALNKTIFEFLVSPKPPTLRSGKQACLQALEEARALDPLFTYAQARKIVASLTWREKNELETSQERQKLVIDQLEGIRALWDVLQKDEQSREEGITFFKEASRLVGDSRYSNRSYGWGAPEKLPELCDASEHCLSLAEDYMRKFLLSSCDQAEKDPVSAAIDRLREFYDQDALLGSFFTKVATSLVQEVIQHLVATVQQDIDMRLRVARECTTPDAQRRFFEDALSVFEDAQAVLSIFKSRWPQVKFSEVSIGRGCSLLISQDICVIRPSAHDMHWEFSGIKEAGVEQGAQKELIAGGSNEVVCQLRAELVQLRNTANATLSAEDTILDKSAAFERLHSEAGELCEMLGTQAITLQREQDQEALYRCKILQEEAQEITKKLETVVQRYRILVEHMAMVDRITHFDGKIAYLLRIKDTDSYFVEQLVERICARVNDMYNEIAALQTTFIRAHGPEKLVAARALLPLVRAYELMLQQYDPRRRDSRFAFLREHYSVQKPQFSSKQLLAQMAQLSST